MAISLRVEPAKLESLADEGTAAAADESIEAAHGLIKEQAEVSLPSLRHPQTGRSGVGGSQGGDGGQRARHGGGSRSATGVEKLGNSAALLSDDLEKLVHEAVAEAMREKLPARRDKWIEKFRELEAERTERVLLEWLRLESTRPAFEVLEHQRQVQLK